MDHVLDKDFLEQLTSVDSSFITEYFHKEFSKIGTTSNHDVILLSYMQYIGRSLIKKGSNILLIDHEYAEPFLSLVNGANPEFNYTFLSVKETLQQNEQLEHYLQNTAFKGLFYCMEISDAIKLKLLENLSLIILTDIEDKSQAEKDLSFLSYTLQNSGHVILHGSKKTIEKLVSLYSSLSIKWFFSYEDKTIFMCQYSISNDKETEETNGFRGLTSFTELEGGEVDIDNLKNRHSSYSTIMPGGYMNVNGFSIAYEPFLCAHISSALLIGHSIVLNRNGKLFTDSLCAKKELAKNCRYWDVPYLSPNPNGGFYLQIPLVEQHCYYDAMLISYSWEENYQHWLFEVLPQVYAAIKLGINMLIVSSNIRKYQLKALEILGYGADRIIIHNLKSAMYCSKIFLGSYTADNMVWVNPGVFSIFDLLIKETKLLSTIPKSRFIYISRSDAEWKRRLLNENELIQQLELIGFLAINPGVLSFEDEVQFSQNAEIIIGATGAGMSNIAFANDGADVIAIESPKFGLNSHFFEMLASCRHQRWHKINAVSIGTMANHGIGPNDEFNTNIIVDINLVLQKVKQIMEKRYLNA